MDGLSTLQAVPGAFPATHDLRIRPPTGSIDADQRELASQRSSAALVLGDENDVSIGGEERACPVREASAARNVDRTGNEARRECCGRSGVDDGAVTSIEMRGERAGVELLERHRRERGYSIAVQALHPAEVLRCLGLASE